MTGLTNPLEAGWKCIAEQPLLSTLNKAIVADGKGRLGYTISRKDLNDAERKALLGCWCIECLIGPAACCCFPACTKTVCVAGTLFNLYKTNNALGELSKKTS